PVTKANLRQAGIKLPRNPKQPLFRYYQYLKKFNFRDIQTCIKIWYDNTQIIDPDLKDYWSRFRNKDIRSTEIFEIALLNPFTNIKKLHVPFYHLEKTRFRDDMNIFVRHLSPRALMVLTWLGLSNFRLCLESLAVLSNCPNLETLDVKSKSFIQVFVTHFPDSLTDLDLDMFITSTLLRKILNICNVNFKKLGLNDKCGITDDHLRILTKYAEHYKSLEEVRFDRWPVIYKNQETEIKRSYESGEFSKLSKAVLEKAGRFIKVIRRDSYDPFFNPMYSY
ncbi:13540_t:CDS:2, partial [Racocetra fulgida]